MSNKNKITLILRNYFLLILACFFSANAFSSDSVIYLDQGWTEQQRKTFYETPQGSYLIPLKWYLALEQADEDDLFSNRENIKKFNYLVKLKSDGNLSRLPVGFAVEPVINGDDWLGYSCAACHTNEIKYKGKRIRVDGAPTLADFAGFTSQMHKAVLATLTDDEKFDRFASRVIDGYNPAAKQSLHQALTDYAADSTAFTARNHTSVNYGYARLDAFGIIMNELFVDDLHVATNASEPNAPISYPFLWGTPQHDWVQWNGGANNPLGRNVGEVLGTFGSVNLTDPSKFGATSARATELILLENLVVSLKSPKWPEEYLGRINQEKAEYGRMLYQQYRADEPSCESCHALRDANGQYPLTPAEENLFGAQFVITNMSPLAGIGTDPTSSLNFATRVVSTGYLAPLLPAPFTGAAELPAPVMLSILVGIATKSSLSVAQPPLSAAQTAAAIGYRVKAAGLPPYRPKNIIAYRARPLDGIWATAPYLHNGSVQNLYQLLKPANKRKKSFYVGSSKFDPKRVGFKSKKRKNTSLLDTSTQSNSNAGHEYGVNLSRKEKLALIEFLKTL